jgi:Leucine-rich repeat (LRR) protein
LSLKSHSFESQFESNHTHLKSNQQTHSTSSSQFIINRLTQFPDDISSLLHLSGLCIDNNKLNQFSSQLPPNLVRLNLYGNSITSISSTTLFSLTRLERLNISGNQITILPTQIGLLTSLQHLNLSNDKLSFIPSGLSCLSNLTHLDLSSNQITHTSQIESTNSLNFNFSIYHQIK